MQKKTVGELDAWSFHLHGHSLVRGSPGQRAAWLPLHATRGGLPRCNGPCMYVDRLRVPNHQSHRAVDAPPVCTSLMSLGPGTCDPINQWMRQTRSEQLTTCLAQHRLGDSARDAAGKQRAGRQPNCWPWWQEGGWMALSLRSSHISIPKSTRHSTTAAGTGCHGAKQGPFHPMLAASWMDLRGAACIHTPVSMPMLGQVSMGVGTDVGFSSHSFAARYLPVHCSGGYLPAKQPSIRKPRLQV